MQTVSLSTAKKALSVSSLAQEHARLSGKCVLFLAFPPPSADYDYTEVFKAVPYLNIKDHGQMVIDGYGFVVCDSEAEMVDFYQQTVGDDGPTATNLYDGPARVYALTIDRDGQLQNENT